VHSGRIPIGNDKVRHISNHYGASPNNRMTPNVNSVGNAGADSDR